MSIRMAALGLLLAPQGLFAAEGSTAFVRGGLSSVGFEQTTTDGSLEAEGGVGLNLSGGFRLDNGFAVRLDMVGSEHDGGTLCVNGVGCGRFDNDVELGEFRAVFLYAPKLSDTVMLEIGAGLEGLGAEVPSLDFESNLGGLVLEGNLVFLASEAWRFNVGVALMGLEEDESNEDVSGAEFRAGFTATAGSVDLGAMLRGLHLENDDGDVENDVGELRLTIGTTWDF